jgi:hypothetical protein
MKTLILSLFIIAATHHPSGARSWKILYVGNSLTYTNDLPALINDIAKDDSITITYTTFAFANYSLEDHWNEGKVEEAIATGHYDFVVAQQGPSALPESQLLLLEYVNRFQTICKKYNAKLLLYMVWPSKARSFDLDNVIRSYTQSAAKTGAALAPAGLAWKLAWRTDASLPLYGPDNFHPGIQGSLLAAMTIYLSLSGKETLDFIHMKGQVWESAITEKQFLLLKQSAIKAIHNR